MQERTIYL